MNPRSIQKVSPLAVTGIGVYSPIGKNAKEFWTNVDAGVCGVRTIQGFPIDDLKVKHAAEIADHNPNTAFSSESLRDLDWTAQFGILAALQALQDAALPEAQLRSSRTGLVVGVCAGGQGPSPKQRTPDNAFDIALESFPETSIYRQTDAIGQHLQIHGPRSTVSTACASSGSALGYAYDLLQTNAADAILVGGTDAFSISTYAGFYALGAMPEKPISPFSDNIGVSFGEGAGFVVLEPLDKAETRGAKVYGLLIGYGCTGDAHHVTSPHPSGEGLQRAMTIAVDGAGLDVRQVDYINAHGTATRDNDRAESSAIRELCSERESPPPVSSSKSQFGHTLGAAGILEFIVSIMASQAGKLPPTVNFQTARPGCDLDYVPCKSRPGNIDTFLSNSAAFGGINVSVLGGSSKHRNHITTKRTDEVWITGVGVVSPIGSGIAAFHESLKKGVSGISRISEFDVSNLSCQHAALMGKFKTRKLAPTLDVRRTDPLNRYAMVAAALAIKESGLEIRPTNSSRIGMVMSLNYGSLAVQERFRDSLEQDGLEQLSAKHFPSMVVSTVGGTVAQNFGLRGYNSTIVDGFTSGLHGLIQAETVLRFHESQDAMIVVAADEVASLLFRVFEERGWLAPTNGKDAPCLKAYQSDARGMLLGEGGVALVVERAEKAKERGAVPLARIAGHCVTSEARLFPQEPSSTKWHEEAMRLSMERAYISSDSIDLVYGHGRGVPKQDAAELAAIAATFGSHRPAFGCLSGSTGVAAATSGMYSVAASLLNLQHGELFPLVGTDSDIPGGFLYPQQLRKQMVSNVLITGTTENGNHSSVVLSKVENE